MRYVLKNYIKLSQRMYRVDCIDAWKLYSLSNYSTYLRFHVSIYIFRRS